MRLCVQIRAQKTRNGRLPHSQIQKKMKRQKTNESTHLHRFVSGEKFRNRSFELLKTKANENDADQQQKQKKKMKNKTQTCSFCVWFSFSAFKRASWLWSSEQKQSNNTTQQTKKTKRKINHTHRLTKKNKTQTDPEDENLVRFFVFQSTSTAQHDKSTHKLPNRNTKHKPNKQHNKRKLVVAVLSLVRSEFGRLIWLCCLPAKKSKQQQKPAATTIESNKKIETKPTTNRPEKAAVLIARSASTPN